MKAKGNIAPSRFVKQDTSNAFGVLQCGAGDKVFGISHQSTRRIPYGALDDGYAAIDGEDLSVYAGLEVCLLEIGGTVAIGDRLKADANGKGVTTTTNLDESGAIALEAGTSGQLITVEVRPGVMLST